MNRQLSFDFTYGVTAEQACIMCHLSSGCGGCCVGCGNKCGSMQACSRPGRGHDGPRFETWMYLVRNHYPELKRFVPKKYLKGK